MSMDLTQDTPVEGVAPAAPRFVPRADVFEEADQVIVNLDMPGADPKGFDLTIENGTLTVHGRVPARHPEDRRWLSREYGIGDFVRTFNLGDSIDPEKISADYGDGVLTIRLPKVEAAKPRKIDVRVK